MPQLPPETPWYVVIAILIAYAIWKLIQPYLIARVQNAAKEHTAEASKRIDRIELEQRKQVAQIESEKAMLSHLGNLVNEVSELAQAFVKSNECGAKERAAWLEAIERQSEYLRAMHKSIDSLPGRIAYLLLPENKDQIEREITGEHEAV